MRTRSYRKQQNFNWMKLYNAKTNISMGIMLIALAIIQFTFTQLTGVRIGIGILFLLLGLINFFTGLKNYRQYRAEA